MSSLTPEAYAVIEGRPSELYRVAHRRLFRTRLRASPVPIVTSSTYPGQHADPLHCEFALRPR
jgi:hypothetical protein